MTMIVVGGHSRKTGKTSVAESLIRALPEYPWIAVKISSHWHLDAALDHESIVHEEHSAEGNSDSSRYLAAGAARSFWIRIRDERADEAIRGILPLIYSGPFAIVESNRILRYVQPELSLMVLNYGVGDFKDSAREMLQKADAIVAVKQGSSPQPWEDVVEESSKGKPVFTTADPRVMPAGLVDFAKSKIAWREA